MRMFWIAALAVIAAAPAYAQVGGNGISKNPGNIPAGTVLGYNQLQPTHGVINPSLCTGAPITQNGQLAGYFLIYDAQGKPHYVPACAP